MVFVLKVGEERGCMPNSGEVEARNFAWIELIIYKTLSILSLSFKLSQQSLTSAMKYVT